LKADYTTLFIAATKNNEEYSRVQYNEDSPGKPWIVDRFGDEAQLYSYKQLTLQSLYSPVKSITYMGLLGRWLGEEHKRVNSQNRPLIGSLCRHFHYLLWSWFLIKQWIC